MKQIALPFPQQTAVAWVLVPILLGCRSPLILRYPAPNIRRITVSADGRGFIFAGTHEPFHPWGMNYGNSGRLMEDFWDSDWLKLFVRLKPEFCPETTGANGRAAAIPPAFSGRSADAFP